MTAALATRRVPDRVILAIACVAQFMVLLDVSIVNVALPSIGHDLHFTATNLQWVVNGYVLTFAGFLLLGGRAADLFGRRRAYLFGLSLFTLASLIGGLAQDPAWLIAARALQGVGGAFLSPATLTIVITTFSGAQRARALGIWSAIAGAGGAAGSLLGGVLTAGLSWRWVLFVNLPVGAAALVAGIACLSETRLPAGADDRRPALDVAGAVTATGGLGALIFAIVGTDTHPWGSTRTVLILAVAAVLLAAFVVIELRVASAPLVPFRIFRSRAVGIANLVMFLVGAGFFSMFYFLSLYLQNILGYGALRAGLAFLPMCIVIVVGAQSSSRLLNLFGVRKVVVPGAAMMALGFLWLSRITDHSSYWTHVAAPSCVIALAIGLLLTPLASAATAAVGPTEAGLASGVLNSARQIGGSLGLAVLATVAVNRTATVLSAGVHATTAATTHDAALVAGYGRAFLFAAGLGVAALLAALMLPAEPASRL